MQTLICLWEPNEKWHGLAKAAQLEYLKSLDISINMMRAYGLTPLGWSQVDQSVSHAPKQGYVGLFQANSQDKLRELTLLIQRSEWHGLFDTVYININPQGGDNSQAGKEYARILNIEWQDK